jgi:tetratricopeptide (TPR) repeat protein
MYLDSRKPRRKDSPWRVLILAVLIIAGLYVVRAQLEGASWARPFDPTPTPTRSADSYFEEGELLYEEGLLDEAIVAYESAFAVDPEDNVALYRLVRLMAFRDRTDQVLERYGARLQDDDLADAR